MKVGEINTESLMGQAKKILKKNQDVVTGTAILGGMTGIGIGLSKLAHDDVQIGHYHPVGFETDSDGIPIDSPTGFIPKIEWTDNPTLLQRIKLKIKDLVSINLDEVPDGIDPSYPYLTNKDGIPLTDEIGLIDNPWYNPQLTSKKILENIGSDNLGFGDTLKDDSGVLLFSPLDLPITDGHTDTIENISVLNNVSASDSVLDIPQFDSNDMPISDIEDFHPQEDNIISNTIDHLLDILT